MSLQYIKSLLPTHSHHHMLVKKILEMIKFRVKQMCENCVLCIACILWMRMKARLY